MRAVAWYVTLCAVDGSMSTYHSYAVAQVREWIRAHDHEGAMWRLYSEVVTHASDPGALEKALGEPFVEEIANLLKGKDL